MKPVVFMFSGQGSQYYQMGADLYSENEYFNKHMNSLNQVIKERFSVSLIDIVYAPQKNLSHTFSDPLLSSLAIYLIEYALAATLIDYGIMPNSIIGSSMGMFIASVFARCIDKYQGLDAIYYLMRLIKEKCTPGCMLAVLDDVKFYYNNPLLKGCSELAGIDPNIGFVLSTKLSNLATVENHLNQANVNFQYLPVSRAYHSQWMDEIKESFLNINLLFQNPSIPIICCSKTDELTTINLANLWHAVRKPLLFSETIVKFEKSAGHRYIDVGPSGMMATCLKYILPKSSSSEIYMILNPYKQATKNLAQALEHCK